MFCFGFGFVKRFGNIILHFPVFFFVFFLLFLAIPSSGRQPITLNLYIIALLLDGVIHRLLSSVKNTLTIIIISYIYIYTL